MAKQLRDASEPPRERGGQRRVLLQLLAALFSPALAAWIGFGAFVRRRGWTFTLVTLSVVGNFFFVVVLVLAFAVSNGESEDKQCTARVEAELPAGFACKRQGPLYFAEVSSERQECSVLGHTIFVAMGGCVVGAFEFDESNGKLSSARLYDDACRPRIDMNVASGVTTYTVYDENGEARFSIRDRDGDGIPDVKIDWSTKQSFRRSGGVAWVLADDQGSKNGGWSRSQDLGE